MMLRLQPKFSINYPPGPKGVPLRGVFPQFLRDPLTLLSQSAATYGDIVALRFFNRTGYLLNHPAYIQHVLVDNNQNYRKGRGLGLVKPVVGEGLLTSEGDFHLRQRRLMQPAFHRHQIAAFAETMVAATDHHIDSWRAGQQRDLHQELMQLTLTIVGQTLFGVDVAGKNRELAHLLDELMREFRFQDGTPWGQLLAQLPTARQRRRQRLLHRLDEAIFGFIEAARQRDPEQPNLLTMLLAAQEADGSRMSNQQLRDELMTLFIAGHETTANALTWSFYLLDQHPAAQAQLVAELETVLGGRLPTLADVPNLKFSRMVFAEAMRLYPPAWVIGRQAIAADQIGGYPIAANAPIFVSQWVMHRHPAYWDQPDCFMPARFDESQPDYQKPPRYVYFPFGGGPRLCIGEQFAWLEGVLLLATLAQRFRFQRLNHLPLKPQALITLRPQGGMPVRLLPG